MATSLVMSSKGVMTMIVKVKADIKIKNCH